MSTNFCVDSSSRFLFKARTAKQTDTQTDKHYWSPHQMGPTHALATVGVN